MKKMLLILGYAVLHIFSFLFFHIMLKHQLPDNGSSSSSKKDVNFFRSQCHNQMQEQRKLLNWLLPMFLTSEVLVTINSEAWLFRHLRILGCCYVTAILSWCWDWGWGWFEPEVEVRLSWGYFANHVKVNKLFYFLCFLQFWHLILT